MRFSIPILAAVLTLMPTGAFAWGPVGHEVVAEIAQRRLATAPAAVTTTISDLLGQGVSLASVANWADDFKYTVAGSKTKRWHYMDVSVTQPEGSWSDLCAPSAEGDCLPAALLREINVLGDKSAGRQARVVALKLVVHLVGDLTQPLHCTERDGDGGGNLLKIDFTGNGPDGQPRLAADKTPDHQFVSFHALWDETLIGDHTFSFGSYVDELEATVVPMITTEALPSPSTGWPSDVVIDGWVKACHRVGVLAYNLLPSGAQPVAVGDAYQKKVQPLIDTQLATAGLRLANVLSAALQRP